MLLQGKMFVSSERSSHEDLVVHHHPHHPYSLDNHYILVDLVDRHIHDIHDIHDTPESLEAHEESGLDLKRATNRQNDNLNRVRCKLQIHALQAFKCSG